MNDEVSVRRELAAQYIEGLGDHEAAARVRAQELAEAWHAPECDADAGGACILHADLKDAWIAGYQAAGRERDQAREEESLDRWYERNTHD